MVGAGRIVKEFVGLASPGSARSGPGGHPCQGLYHHLEGSTPRVALIATHYNIDFSEHYLAEPLAKRGFGFLGWNTRYRGAEPYFLLERALIDIGTGVRWLRERGTETIVLLGNSGGGSLMAAYQSQAVAPSLTALPGRARVHPVADLEPGDLYVSVAAHPGRAEVLTNWMDPSVTDETDPLSVDPELDPYHPDRRLPFEADFVAAYQAAQRARNERITLWCLDELDRLAEHGHRDRLFVVPRLWADLRMIDGTIDPSNRKTPWCYLGDPQWANYSTIGVGVVSSIYTWLSMWSLRHTQSGPDDLLNVNVPALVIDADADTGVFSSDTDKIIATLKRRPNNPPLQTHTMSADHYFLHPPQARKDLANQITTWLHSHK